MVINSDKIKEVARAVGVTQVGITTAEPLFYMQKRLKRRLEEKRTTPFEEKNPVMRLSPTHLLNNCRSIITLAIPYAVPEDNSSNNINEPRGIVARCARSVDYHLLVERKAMLIVEAIQDQATSHFNYKILSDRSPLLERELACNSNLGLIGENCTLINSRYGSYTVLGTILIDQEIEIDHSLNQFCLQCGECRRACPTGALTEPYIIDPYRCRSYLTQASGVVPLEIRYLLANHIYGCDLCQEACPLNHSVEKTPYPELAFFLFPAEPLIIPMLQMTRREFDLTIGLTSAGWRGKTTLQRNAVIALGNSKDLSAVKTLSTLIKQDPRPLIRQHTAWALGQIGGDKSKYYLEKSRQNDPESAVRMEAELALNNYR